MLVFREQSEIFLGLGRRVEQFRLDIVQWVVGLRFGWLVGRVGQIRNKKRVA